MEQWVIKWVDYYSFLVLEQTATQDQILDVIQALFTKYHPDLNMNASPTQKKQYNKLTQQLNEAKHILTNSNLRKDYDREWQRRQSSSNNFSASTSSSGSSSSSNNVNYTSNSTSSPKPKPSRMQTIRKDYKFSWFMTPFVLLFGFFLSAVYEYESDSKIFMLIVAGWALLNVWMPIWIKKVAAVAGIFLILIYWIWGFTVILDGYVGSDERIRAIFMSLGCMGLIAVCVINYRRKK